METADVEAMRRMTLALRDVILTLQDIPRAAIADGRPCRSMERAGGYDVTDDFPPGCMKREPDGSPQIRGGIVMHRFAKHLFIATMLLLPAIVDARPTALRQRCDAPGGVVTRQQARIGGAAYAGCQVLEVQEPTCNPDNTLCACFNTGTVQDFVICGWDLIADCEATPGCAWWQKENGDVYCACGANPLP